MLNHDNQCRHYRKQYTIILIFICLEHNLFRAQTILNRVLNGLIH